MTEQEIIAFRIELHKKLVNFDVNYLNKTNTLKYEIEVLRYLFLIKEKGLSRDELINVFNGVRQNALNDLYSHYEKLKSLNGVRETEDQEDAHIEFVNCINEAIIEYNPRPHFWDVSFEEYIKRFPASR